jgi:hypothetical protein
MESGRSSIVRGRERLGEFKIRSQSPAGNEESQLQNHSQDSTVKDYVLCITRRNGYELRTIVTAVNAMTCRLNE